jgi:hypothetical protein
MSERLEILGVTFALVLIVAAALLVSVSTGLCVVVFLAAAVVMTIVDPWFSIVLWGFEGLIVFMFAPWPTWLMGAYEWLQWHLT